MNPSFDLPDADHFTAGTVGPPGQRTFFLQAGSAGSVVSLKMEKQQVAALADHLDGMLADLPPVAPPDAPELVEPVVPTWTVGGLGVAFDEDADRVVIVAQELIDDDVDEDDAASARLRLTRDQVAAFIARARQLVSAGRPPCQFCGLPLDPAGHACPRAN
ncbi:MAG TPA: DUF3090 domain-containing protein [Acidimicrobiales bacterium]|nr:DUF3090 domain-containing protein [Acidimicrobiales bacterium]